MAYEFRLPDLGEGLTEGEVARWLVAEGDEIAEDQPLVEIQTDKTTVEIPSPAAGIVTKILVADGDVVPVGTVLVVIGGDGPDGRAAPAASAPAWRRGDPPLTGTRRRPRAGDAARPADRGGARRRPRDGRPRPGPAAASPRPTCAVPAGRPPPPSPRVGARSCAACGGRSPST